MNQKRLFVHLKLIGMAFFWGVSWPTGKISAMALPPFISGAYRFSLAVVILLIWLRLEKGYFPKLTFKQTAAIIVGGVVGVFGYGAFFMYGLQLVPAGRASLVVTINPVLTTLIAAWLFKEFFNWKVAIGMVLAALGASIVLSHGEPWKLLQGEIGKGELILLGAVLCWASYSLLGKRTMQGIDPLTTTTYTATTGLICLWIASLIFEGIPNLQLLTPLPVWTSQLFLALGATVLAYAWYFEGIKILGAGAAASYISFVPVFGVISSAWLLGESIDGSIIVGGVLAMTGVYWMNRARAAQ